MNRYVQDIIVYFITPSVTQTPASPPKDIQIDLSIAEHQIMNTFIEIVKAKDTSLLFDFIQINTIDTADRHGNREHDFYNTFFDYLLVDINHDLTNLFFTVESEDKPYNHYQYSIRDLTTNKQIGLVASIYEKQFYWSYLFYIPYTKQMISDYIAYIIAEDLEGLTSIMTVDDLQYDIKNSEQIIYNYKQYFGDIDELYFEYSGDFKFIIFNKQNKSHIINIVYGDGLMGVEDNLVPNPYE